MTNTRTPQKSADSSKEKRPNVVRDLALLFSIPVAVLLLAGIAVYSPRLLAHPSRDFIYQACADRYNCLDSYAVDDGVVVPAPEQTATSVLRRLGESKLYYYDVSEKTVTPISLEEAKKYTLDTASKSSDGYILQYHSRQSGGLFWSSSESGWRLEKGWLYQDVELVGAYNYYNDTRPLLVGWVK